MNEHDMPREPRHARKSAPRSPRMDWLALESRLRQILREGFQDDAQALAPATTAEALRHALHRIDASLAAFTLRGDCYPADVEACDERTREVRAEEWEHAEREALKSAPRSNR